MLVLAVGGEVTADARQLANDRGVHMWDGNHLVGLENATPPREPEHKPKN